MIINFTIFSIPKFHIIIELHWSLTIWNNWILYLSILYEFGYQDGIELGSTVFPAHYYWMIDDKP